jgi:outer membrane immunogenic protein
MKKALLSTVALVGLFASPSMAADIAVVRPIYRAPVAAVANWTGFYIGGNVGGSIGIVNETDTDTGALSETANDRRALPGAIGGLQAGYNWQSGLWLLGLEGDWQWSNEESTRSSQFIGTGPFAGVRFNSSDQDRIRNLATVRGRVGYVYGDYLWFATGGAAWSRVESNLAITGAAFATSASLSTTRSGWTVGGGVETLLAPNWSAKLEYLYVDLGSINNVEVTPAAALGAFTANEKVSEHVIRVGLNYKFGSYPIFGR